tara:strand:+ start:1214 stop:1615 length:402 start_codon:yes stop_codon:yes gene_type:complete
MPAAVIIKGTIIGEISIAIIKPLYGMCGLLRPRAAIVPKVVAIKVAVIPMKKLLTVPVIHLVEHGTVEETTSELQLPIIFWYHLNDHASGSGGHESMPSVKTINGETLNEIGTIANKGATRKKNTILQKNKYA